jgi:hypothetical protein
MKARQGGWRTFVFQKIAHACSTSKDELRYVLYYLRFVLGGKGCEPLCEALKLWLVSVNGERGAQPTTLPCRESKIKYLYVLATE